MRTSASLAVLLAFLRPGVPDGDDATGAQDTSATADAGAADAGAADDQLDLDLDAGSTDDATQDQVDPKVELENAKREAKEAKEARERVERELAEQRVRAQPLRQPSEEDRIRAEEDKILNDASADELSKWRVQSNRILRSNTSAAQFALAQAQDVSDKTSFTAVCMSDPLAKKYESRVEQELAQVRSRGQNASRESIYTYLLGKDVREGKLKKKSAASTSSTSGAGTPNSGVNRGKLPGARSDVRAGSGGLTRKQQLEKRLDGQPI